MNEFQKLVIALDKGWGADWSSADQIKYYIYTFFGEDGGRDFDIGETTVKKVPGVLYMSEDAAKEACRALKEGEIPVDGFLKDCDEVDWKNPGQRKFYVYRETKTDGSLSAGIDSETVNRALCAVYTTDVAEAGEMYRRLRETGSI